MDRRYLVGSPSRTRIVLLLGRQGRRGMRPPKPVSKYGFTPTTSGAEPFAPGDRPNDWYDSAGWQDGYATVLSESLPQTPQRASLASQPPRYLQTPQTISRLLLPRPSEPTQPMEHRLASYRDWK